MDRFEAFVGRVPSPSFVIDRGVLRRNAAVLADVQERSGAKVLLALKGFAAFPFFDELRGVLAGCSGSGAWEGQLAREEFGGEVHLSSAAYSDDEFEACLGLADHLVFNSLGQWERFGARVLECGREVSCGLRVNPECRQGKVALYDPCVAGSRLGVRAAEIGAAGGWPEGVEGLHVHTLCEQNSDALERMVEALEERFGRWLEGLKWVNLGGGHHLVAEGYDIDRLVRVVRRFRERWGVEVVLEPGEGVVLGSGCLVATVEDVLENDGAIAMLDVSATAHMPDVLEMPYRPEVAGAGMPGEKAFTFRLGGSTCLAGDFIGEYSFDAPLEVGDRLVFEEMAHYTLVKTTMFNGVVHPALVSWDPGAGEVVVVRRFGYEDYRGRMG
ncbi:MAG: carboxynorspermidine decarboxylase [Verrucomicrobiales bacterium]|nr:carboxynorspermidine decarboxylase [Verrucomicrobiales bacterium]